VNLKIFLTGSEGRVGTYFSQELTRRKIDFVGFDKKKDEDLLDLSKIEESISDCDFVLHLAVTTDETNNQNILGDNLQAVFNLHKAVEKIKIKKFVFMSSVDVLGIFKGEAVPAYFPIDDLHPCRPSTEYGIAKRLSEELCKTWSERTGIPSISLRPPGIWFRETYDEIFRLRRERESYEWDPYWEYGAFIDIRDLFDVSILALESKQINTYESFLVSSMDISSSGRSSLELVEMLHPKIRWKDKKPYEEDEYRSILNCNRAMSYLNWKPKYSWKEYIARR
jgi:nucleoside-diphosphate-sugar epimerase